MRWKVIAFVAVIASAAGGAYLLWGRGGGDDRAAFFALPTPGSCPGRELSVTVDSARFAAFLPGRQLAEANEKFLAVALTVTNASATPQTFDIDHLSLSDRPGHQLPGSRRDDDVGALTLGQGEVGAATAYFSVPVAVGAAKLTYDDGCAHQEWAVP